MAKSEPMMNLKLLVDKSSNKVLFAEADNEFVDFIFHMMSLPLGTVVKLLNQKKMVGCLGDLYKSVESLKTQYFQSDFNKDSVLNPTTTVNVPLLSLNEAPPASPAYSLGKFFKCSSSRYVSCPNYVTDTQGQPCGQCGGGMHAEMKYVGPTVFGKKTPSSNGESGGYVKGVVTYMVMDNLEVQPMSTISAITMMNKLHIKDVASLVEKEVEVGLKEGLAILKASLENNTVLTSVFLGKKI